MKAKISLVTLGVRDFARALAFYRDGLGLPLHAYTEGDDHAMFALEGTWLSLYPRDKLAADATVPDDGSGFSGVTLAHNVASKAAVDAVFAEALAAGARAVKPPQDVFWGGYHAYVADPDGQLWELAYNPFTDLT
jgi:catechol 2,3-dioxygenase-like lactoylglutathione lyase family enzyme